MVHATVIVVGAGQAGLSAGHHLAHRGFRPAPGDSAERTFVILDANPAAGGAWQHRWESLHMATVNGIFGLPGFPVPQADHDEPSRDALPAYFAIPETFDLAADWGSPVLAGYRAGTPFPGKLSDVTFDFNGWGGDGLRIH